MISAIISIYRPSYINTLVYIMQSSNYRAGKYLKIFWGTQNFSTVMGNEALRKTRGTTQILWLIRLAVLLEIGAGLLLIGLWYWRNLAGGWQFGLAIIIGYPVIIAHLIAIKLYFYRLPFPIPTVAPKTKKPTKKTKKSTN